MNIEDLPRGFDTQEFEQRVEKTQAMMAEKKLDAILITTEAIFRYYTGFNSQFWASPTRPWFLVIPSKGKPIGVVPSIGEYGLKNTWLDEIHSWSAPRPEDDGVSLLTSVLQKNCKRHQRLGMPLGRESQVRMPYLDFQRVLSGLPGVELVDVSEDIHRIRSIKSYAEVQKIAKACHIASEAFEMLPVHAEVGQNEREICRDMRKNMIEYGSDRIPYLIIGTGQGGYESIIMGPTDRIVQKGDILIIDTGVCFDGYYADFCRNFAFGYVDDATKKANEVVYNAIEEGFKIVKPGVTTTDIYNAMWSVMVEGGALGNDIGRIGHGLGSELTEWPSITLEDNTTLVEGMVITLEPGMEYGNGKSMVHEENILVTEDGAQWLSRREYPEVIVIQDKDYDKPTSFENPVSQDSLDQIDW